LTEAKGIILDSKADHMVRPAAADYSWRASSGEIAMIVRRLAMFGLPCTALLGLSAEASAQGIRVIETKPADKATIESQSEGFLVRFDRPVDHVRSTLTIKRGEEVVQTLRPRLKAAPDVLFARSAALEPGDYTLHWTVNALDGSGVLKGQIAFSVAADKRTPN
jgi:methionine-rich copper-binding protein CopC